MSSSLPQSITHTHTALSGQCLPEKREIKSNGTRKRLVPTQIMVAMCLTSRLETCLGVHVSIATSPRLTCMVWLYKLLITLLSACPHQPFYKTMASLLIAHFAISLPPSCQSNYVRFVYALSLSLSSSSSRFPIIVCLLACLHCVCLKACKCLFTKEDCVCV